MRRLQRRPFTAILAALLVVACAACGTKSRAKADLPSRSFNIGFTPWPYDLSLWALFRTDSEIKSHGDIISQHFEEGVPWPEALAIKPYQKGMEKELRDRVQRMKGRKRVVSISPLNNGRNGLAAYRGDKANLPLPKPWDTMRLNDARATAA